MKRHVTLSIIIVTKNRTNLLAMCLSSLAGQLHLGDEIIIVDNYSTDTTSEVITSFADKLPIRSYKSRGSYPTLYNKGARRAKGDILVFFDDDCRASPLFARRIRLAHNRHPDALIQGMTQSIPKGNIYADIMGDHYRNWLETMRLGENELKTFDNKNASISRALFWRYNGFSPTMSRGSEDIEFGLRLHRHGVHILFDPSILAYHHERDTFTGFIYQHRRFAAAEGYLDKILPSSERLGLIPMKKLFLHMRSGLNRELYYLGHGQLGNAVKLPLLYLALAWIRFWGYATNR